MSMHYTHIWSYDLSPDALMPGVGVVLCAGGGHDNALGWPSGAMQGGVYNQDGPLSNASPTMIQYTHIWSYEHAVYPYMVI